MLVAYGAGDVLYRTNCLLSYYFLCTLVLYSNSKVAAYICVQAQPLLLNTAIQKLFPQSNVTKRSEA